MQCHKRRSNSTLIVELEELGALCAADIPRGQRIRIMKVNQTGAWIGSQVIHVDGGWILQL